MSRPGNHYRDVFKPYSGSVGLVKGFFKAIPQVMILLLLHLVVAHEWHKVDHLTRCLLLNFSVQSVPSSVETSHRGT